MVFLATVDEEPSFPEAKVFPPGLNDTLLIGEACPSSVLMALPVRTFHKRTVLPLPEVSTCPSGLNTTV